jgi:hypothetical protein
VKEPWLRDLVQSYAGWTAQANGVGLDATEDVENPPWEWNNAYFDLLAYCLPGLALSDIEQLALGPICALPDRSFFDLLPSFLRSLDVVYFNHRTIEQSVAVSVRSRFADRLMVSAGWKRLRGQRGSSIETHIGPAIALLFFNDYGFAQPPKCYLVKGSIDQLPPFLPVLEELVKSSPSLFVAIVTLNLLEVAIRPPHLPFIVEAAKAWLGSYANDSEFWVAHGIGRRVCLAIEEIRHQEPGMLGPDKPVRFDVDRSLTAIISLGVPEARRLEEILASGLQSN